MPDFLKTCVLTVPYQRGFRVKICYDTLICEALTFIDEQKYDVNRLTFSSQFLCVFCKWNSSQSSCNVYCTETMKYSKYLQRVPQINKFLIDLCTCYKVAGKMKNKLLFFFSPRTKKKILKE